MAFSVPADVAQKVLGFMRSGRAGRITFLIEGQDVVAVECADVWMNPAAGARRFRATEFLTGNAAAP